MSECPYKKILVDEVSGIEYVNPEWIAWHEGRKIGFNEGFKEGQLAVAGEGQPSIRVGWVCAYCKVFVPFNIAHICQ